MLQISCSVIDLARCCTGACAVWISVIPCFSTNYTPTQPSRSPPTLRLLSMTSNFMSQVRALPRMVAVFIRSLYVSCMCSYKEHFVLRQSTDLRPPWAPRVKSLFVSYALRGSYSATAHVHSCSGTCAWHSLSIPFLPTLCRPIDAFERSTDSELSIDHVHRRVPGTIVNTPCLWSHLFSLFLMYVLFQRTAHSNTVYRLKFLRQGRVKSRSVYYASIWAYSATAHVCSCLLTCTRHFPVIDSQWTSVRFETTSQWRGKDSRRYPDKPLIS